MEVCPSIILLSTYAHTSFRRWTAVLWGALHRWSSSLTLSSLEPHGPCSLPADATLRLQVAGAIVYRCTSPRSLSHLPAFWVEHPPGTLPRPFILHPDEATVQRQIVPDRILQQERKIGERKREREEN